MLQFNILRGPPMPQECWLYYGMERAIKVNRQRMAQSCRYFEVLLNGPYLEGRQSVISLHLLSTFSFEVFACVINYANEGKFLPDPEEIDVYIAAIQLSILWDYVDFKEVLELYLISELSINNLAELSGLAINHRFSLDILYQACDDFEKNVRYISRIPSKWIIRCPLDDHFDLAHHHINCSRSLSKQEGSGSANVDADAEQLWLERWEHKELFNCGSKSTALGPEEERYRLVEAREKRSAGYRSMKPPEYNPGSWLKYLP